MKKELLRITMCLICAMWISTTSLFGESDVHIIKSWYRRCKVTEIAPDWYKVVDKYGRSGIYHGHTNIIPMTYWDSINVKQLCGWQKGGKKTFIHKKYHVYVKEEYSDGTMSMSSYRKNGSDWYDNREIMVPRYKWDSISIRNYVYGWLDGELYYFKKAPQSIDDILFKYRCDSVKRLPVAIFPSNHKTYLYTFTQESQNIATRYIGVYRNKQCAIFNYLTQQWLTGWSEIGDFQLQPTDIRLYERSSEVNAGEFKKYCFVKYTKDSIIRAVLYSSDGDELVRGYDEYRLYNPEGFWGSGEWYDKHKKYPTLYPNGSEFYNGYVFGSKLLIKYIAARKTNDPKENWAFCDSIGNEILPVGKYRDSGEKEKIVYKETTSLMGDQEYSIYTLSGDLLLEGADKPYGKKYDEKLNYLYDSYKRIDNARANLFRRYMETEIYNRLDQWMEKRSYESTVDYKKRVTLDNMVAKFKELRVDFLNKRGDVWFEHIGGLTSSHQPGNPKSPVANKITYNEDREQFTVTCGHWGSFQCDVPSAEADYFEQSFQLPETEMTIQSVVSYRLKDYTPYAVKITLPNNKKYTGYFVYSDEIMELIQDVVNEPDKRTNMDQLYRKLLQNRQNK